MCVFTLPPWLWWHQIINTEIKTFVFLFSYKNQRARSFIVFGKMGRAPLCHTTRPRVQTVLAAQNTQLVFGVYRPRYSATNKTRILVRFNTVGRCMFSSVSSNVCQNFGKGVLMRCNTGTPWYMRRRGRKKICLKPPTCSSGWVWTLY